MSDIKNPITDAERRVIDANDPVLGGRRQGIDLYAAFNRLVSQVLTRFEETDAAIVDAGNQGPALPDPVGTPGAVIVENDALGTRVQRRLKQDEIDPTFALVFFEILGSGLVEVGAPLPAVTLFASFTTAPDSLLFFDTVSGLVQPTPARNVVSTRVGAFGGIPGPLDTPGKLVTFFLSGVGDGTSFQGSVQIEAATRTYIGTGPIPPVFDQAFIASLPSRPLVNGHSFGDVDLEFRVTADAGEYIWYVHPARYPEPLFRIINLEAVFDAEVTFSVTNNFGFTEDYVARRSRNPGLGPTDVTVQDR